MRAKPNTNHDKRIPLVAAATAIGMSSNGLLYILKKTNSAIRDDGHWFCTPEALDRIRKARRDLAASTNKTPLVVDHFGATA